jgi:hypothetical protein
MILRDLKLKIRNLKKKKNFHSYFLINIKYYK